MVHALLWILVVATLVFVSGGTGTPGTLRIPAGSGPDRVATSETLAYTGQWLSDGFLDPASPVRRQLLEGARRPGGTLTVPDRVSPGHRIRIRPATIRDIDPIGAYGRLDHELDLGEGVPVRASQEFRLGYQALPPFFDAVTLFREDAGTGRPAYSLAPRIEAGDRLERVPGPGSRRRLEILTTRLDRVRLETKIRFRPSDPERELPVLLGSGNARGGVIHVAAGDRVVSLRETSFRGGVILFSESPMLLSGVTPATPESALWILSTANVTLSGEVHARLVTSGELLLDGGGDGSGAEPSARIIGGLILRGGYRALPPGLVVERPEQPPRVRWVEAGRPRPGPQMLGIALGDLAIRAPDLAIRAPDLPISAPGPSGASPAAPPAPGTR